MSKILTRLRGVAAVAATTALVLTGCSSTASTLAESSDGLTEVTVALGWLPTAESGGFYAAQQLGYYKAAGLDVTIEPGGPQVSGTQLVASGKVQFGITGSGSNEIVAAREQGIPLKAVNAIMQDSATGMMVHADTGIGSLKDTAGMTWLNSPGVLGPEWAKKTLGITFAQQQYTGSLANFLHDDKLVQQGIASNEPYVAHEQGAAVKFLPFSDIGFNPYNTVTYVTDNFLKTQPDIVKKFVSASNQGWRDYVGDVKVATDVNTHLTKDVDKTLDAALVWFEWDAQRKYILAGDGARRIGAMNRERWQALIDQMRKLGVVKKSISVDDVADFDVTGDLAPAAEQPAAPSGSYDPITY